MLVVAVTPDDEVLFVEQPRAPGQAHHRMPAGWSATTTATPRIRGATRTGRETGWEPGRVGAGDGADHARHEQRRIALVQAWTCAGSATAAAWAWNRSRCTCRVQAPAWLTEAARLRAGPETVGRAVDARARAGRIAPRLSHAACRHPAVAAGSRTGPGAARGRALAIPADRRPRRPGRAVRAGAARAAAVRTRPPHRLGHRHRRHHRAASERWTRARSCRRTRGW